LLYVIESNAWVEVIKDGERMLVKLPEERNYLVPLDVQDLLNVLREVKREVRWDGCLNGCALPDLTSFIEKEVLSSYPAGVELSLNCDPPEIVEIDGCLRPLMASCTLEVNVDFPPWKLPVTHDFVVRIVGEGTADDSC